MRASGYGMSAEDEMLRDRIKKVKAFQKRVHNLMEAAKADSDASMAAMPLLSLYVDLGRKIDELERQAGIR